MFIRLSFLLSVLLLTACNKSSNPRNDFVANTPPVIGAVADQQIFADEDSTPISISISDEATTDANLIVSLNSSNQQLISNVGLIITAINNGVAELTIRPNADSIGQTTVTITVRDDGGFTSSVSFAVTVSAQQVAATTFIRTIFANDKDSDPVSINGIELIQDTTDESEFDDLIDS